MEPKKINRLGLLNDHRRGGGYLKHREQTVGERVEIRSGLDNGRADLPHGELSAKDLRAQQRENAQKEEEQHQQGHDGLHGVDKRGQEILKRPPVSAKRHQQDSKFSNGNWHLRLFYCTNVDMVGYNWLLYCL